MNTHNTPHSVEEEVQRVMKNGIKQIAGRIEALHPQYFLDEKTYQHDVKGTMDVVKMVMADIEEALTSIITLKSSLSFNLKIACNKILTPLK